jgi:ATP-dependent helicase/nuclease subunit A
MRSVDGEISRYPKRSRIDAARIGTVTHLVLSCIPLEGPITQEVVRETIDQLVQEGTLSESLADQVDRKGIVMFFLSPLGQIVLDPVNRVYREWLFTMRVPADEVLGPGAGTEPVVVQGVADLVLVTPTGAVVIDFKTDRSSQDQMGSNGVLYRRQVTIYARAVESILGVTVMNKWIYYLVDDRALSIA